MLFAAHKTMITGLPPYDHKTPVRCDASCGQCKRRYLVFNGTGDVFDSLAEASAREYAQERGRVFIDSRVTPFMECVTCRAPLAFVDSADLVM